MSGERRAYLDACPGERRGVVTLDGRPERLLIERDGEPTCPRLGERRRIRLGPRLGEGRDAFVDLGQGDSGLLRLPACSPFAEGALLQGEVVTEPQGRKAAVLRLLGPAEVGAAPGLIAPGPSLEARLRALAPEASIAHGPEAREAADEAEEAVLAVEHRLRGGAVLWIEATRALTAVDVDMAEAGGRAQDLNLRALRHAVRLLQLKGLGGTAAIDLIGFPKAAGLMLAEARRALAPDGPEASALAPNRLGVLMLSRPRRERPVAEAVLGPDGALSARSRAQRLVRALERDGRADPGALLRAVCAPDVAAALAPLAAELGPRFGVREDPGAALDRAHIERR